MFDEAPSPVGISVALVVERVARNVSKRTVDHSIGVPVPQMMEEIEIEAPAPDVRENHSAVINALVLPGTHASNDCIQAVKLGKEKLAKLEEVSSNFCLKLQMLTKSPRSRLAERQAHNEVDRTVAQSRKGQQLALTSNSFSPRFCVNSNIS